MLRNKIITTTGSIIAGGVGVTVGALAAVAVVGVSTSATGRIIYGSLAYFVAAGISQKATELVVEPIVELIKTDDNEH